MNKNHKASKFIDDYQSKINWKVVVFAGIAVIILAGLMVVFNLDWLKNQVVKNVILSILSSLAVSTFILGIWEVIAKKSFAEEILNLADISNNLRASGVAHVYINFLEISWREIISSCDELTAVIAYGKTWREQNRDVLEDLCKRAGKLTVYLPDYNNPDVVNDLGRRFDSNSDAIKSLIEESADFFKNINATVYLHNGTFQNSYYVIDNIAIMSFYNHHKTKGVVPAIKAVSSGSLFVYIQNEITAIKTNSTMIAGGTTGEK